MAKQKVVHFRFKNSTEDFFFGSLKAIYDYFSEEDVGIKYKSLLNAFKDKDTYQNKRVVITTGTLLTKRQTNKHQQQ